MVSKNVLIGVLFLSFAVLLTGCIQGGSPSTGPSSGGTPGSSQGSGTAGTGIPVYPGSEHSTMQTVYAQLMGVPSGGGITVNAYHVKGVSAGDVLNWYKQQLSSYQLVKGGSGLATVSIPGGGEAQYGVVMFKNGDQGIGIWAMSGSKMDGTTYYVVTGPASAMFGEETGGASQLPSSDKVSGEEPVSRYPGSVMLSYSNESGYPTHISIEYGTNEGMAKVFDWYKNYLSSNGWNITSQSQDTETATIECHSGPKDLTVTIYAADSENGYTTVDIDLDDYTLPSHDIVTGEDPIQRYPGSIMMEYQSNSQMGVKMAEVEYQTSDDLNTVVNWYKSHLPGMGFEINNQEQTDVSEVTITATKTSGSTQDQVTLDISKGTYTTIHLSYTQVSA